MSNDVESREITRFTQASHAGLESIQKIEKQMIDMVKANATFNIETGLTQNDDIVNYHGSFYPIVVLISGAGGNGKDTFVENCGKYCAAYNLSSINEIKEIAKTLCDYTDELENNGYITPEICAGKHCVEKSDRYRQFLHQLKMAWSDFCDGPNQVLIGNLKKTIELALNGGENYDLIFMHVREAAEITQLKNTIEDELGLFCITVKVSGLVDPSTYENDCDKNVDEYEFDFNIQNHENQEAVFAMQAMLFAQGMIAANKQYGTSFLYYEAPDRIDDGADNTFQNAVNLTDLNSDSTGDSVKVYTGFDFATSASGNEPDGTITARN